jgi:hypothetical protein
MSIVFILLGALPATLFIVSKLQLSTPPAEHLLVDITPTQKRAISREDIRLAA